MKKEDLKKYESTKGKEFATIMSKSHNVNDSVVGMYEDVDDTGRIKPGNMHDEIIIFNDSLIKIYARYQVLSDTGCYITIYKDAEDGIEYCFGFHVCDDKIFYYENAELKIKGERLYLKDMTTELEEECLIWYKRIQLDFIRRKEMT